MCVPNPFFCRLVTECGVECSVCLLPLSCCLVSVVSFFSPRKSLNISLNRPSRDSSSFHTKPQPVVCVCVCCPTYVYIHIYIAGTVYLFVDIRNSNSQRSMKSMTATTPKRTKNSPTTTSSADIIGLHGRCASNGNRRPSAAFWVRQERLFKVPCFVDGSTRRKTALREVYIHLLGGEKSGSMSLR